MPFHNPRECWSQENNGALSHNQSLFLFILPCPLSSHWPVGELKALLSTGSARGKTTLVFQLSVGADF